MIYENLEFNYKCNTPQLNEVQIFIDDINPEYIDDKLVIPIKDAIENKSIYHFMDGIGQIPYKYTETIYVLIENNKIVAGINIEKKTICNKIYLIPHLTYKFFESKSIVYKILSIVSSKLKKPIMSDEFVIYFK